MGFWQIDDAGVSLWLDVRNGGSGVRLGERRLEAATIVTAASRGHARLLAGAQDFCHRLCDRPRLPAAPVYGWNNWYYTYGVGFSSNDIRRDCAALAQLAPARAEHRPFMLIDMGWGVAPDGAGPWNRGNDRFADLPDLAPQMKAAGVRPGIWMRPLLTTESLAERWLLPDRGVTKPGFAILDPTVPQALERVRAAVQTLAGWGFELIKHDFTTYDLLGKWGFQMGGDVTTDGWHFADRSVTTAEVILRLYRAIREAAGSALLIGCNTVGHLGAGLFELQRIGDDNSGFDWHRTRRMGVNALAFRMAQHQRFFAADADCAPLTAKVPWSMSRQWLDLLARSGTPLFVSADPTQLNPEQHQAVQAALAAAAQDLPPAEPLDWLETSVPRRWRLGQRTATYDWLGDEGASAWSR
jgi:alpha-galactosidase